MVQIGGIWISYDMLRLGITVIIGIVLDWFCKHLVAKEYIRLLADENTKLFAAFDTELMSIILRGHTEVLSSKARWDKYGQRVGAMFDAQIERTVDGNVVTVTSKQLQAAADYEEQFDSIVAKLQVTQSTRTFRYVKKKLDRARIQYHLYWRYTSPKGYASYASEAFATPIQVLKSIQDAQKHIAWKKTEEAKHREERAKMSNRLRYDVLHRDGFRCVKCGASAASGATLHVDHIVPISRGGKTRIDNLQTLCDRCNLGKGNRYEE